MFTTLRNAWKIPELRKKILFTLFVLLIYRLGACVPVPYVNVAELATYFSQQLSGTVLGLYNAMSGSAFSQATVFAIGIQPYINASIIIELLAIAIPALERLAKEGGEEGQKKIQRITRYTTVGLALLMGFAYYVMLKNYNLLNETGFLAGLVIVVTFMAGASFLMWMGEQIDQFGIGNGISMILFAGIISRIPSLVSALVSSLASGAIKWYTAILLVLGMLLIVVFIVFITNSERRIPVQYAKRVVGRKMYGGQSTFLPVRRSADHLRAVHCDAPRDDHRLHRHRQQLLLDVDEHLYLRHEERVLHRLLLPADHCVQLLLCNDSVQPDRNRQ